MYKKIHLKRKISFSKLKIKKLKLSHKFILLFFLLVVCLILSFRYVNTKISPLISGYATVEAKKIASFVMNKAISKNISDILNMDELFIISKNSNNEINTIDFNPLVVNKVLTKITEVVHASLENLEKGNVQDLQLPKNAYLSNYQKMNQGIIFEIPSGVVFDNVLLSNLGPKIPVKLSFVGDIISNIDTQVTNYGINNALIEINLHLKVTEKVILPINIEELQIELTIPIALKIIQGNIPDYYLNGLNGSSSILTVPLE